MSAAALTRPPTGYIGQDTVRTLQDLVDECEGSGDRRDFTELRARVGELEDDLATLDHVRNCRRRGAVRLLDLRSRVHLMDPRDARDCIDVVLAHLRGEL